MNITEKKFKHLTLLTLPATKSSLKKGIVLILGNAYGIMSYQIPLAENLSKKGIEPWWFAFSGQEGNTGVYSLETGIQDIRAAMEYLSLLKKDKPLWVIAHCAGSLMALEYLKDNPNAEVEKLIVYGLLFKPNRRKKFALKKFGERGVNVALSIKEWDYNPLQAISRVQIPILFCHAKDKLNLFRTREDEMKDVFAVAQNAEIAWFDKGYDNDLDVLPTYVDCYYSFMITSALHSATV